MSDHGWVGLCVICGLLLVWVVVAVLAWRDSRICEPDEHSLID